MCVQFWLNINIENDIRRLRPTRACCCVKSITFNAVTNGKNTHMHACTHAYTHKHTHTYTYTNHKSQSVQRNDEYKILWDFNIQKDQVLEVRSPDIVWSTSKI